MKITSITKPENKKRAVKIDGFNEGKWSAITEDVYVYLAKTPFPELSKYEVKDVKLDENGTHISFISFVSDRKNQFQKVNYYHNKNKENRTPAESYSIRQTALIQARELIASVFEEKFKALPKDITQLEAEGIFEGILKIQYKIANENLKWIQGNYKPEETEQIEKIKINADKKSWEYEDEEVENEN